MAKPTIQIFTAPHCGPRIDREAGKLGAALRTGGAAVIHTPDEAHPLAIADRADIVVAVGGDGTLRYVADAVRRLGRPVAIGVFPAGTINLVARERELPRDAAAFARHLLGDRTPSPLHIALVEELPLLACASVGPDSYAVARTSARLKRRIGRIAYLAAFARLLLRWPRIALRVRHDGGALACEAVYVAKGRFYAGPWSFAPDAALDTPTLHVVTLERATRARFLRFMLQLLLRRPVGALAGVRQFQSTSLEIESAIGAPVQADGDVLFALPVSIRMTPVALDIL